MSDVPGGIVDRRDELSLKSPAGIFEPVSAICMYYIGLGFAERRSFVSAVPEGYAEGGGDL